MTDWFRSWHGAPTDNKWLLIARKAGASPGIVSAVVWALLDHASQQNARGSISTFDVETYSTFSGFDEAQIEAIIKAMTDKGIIIDGRLASWDKRQPKREDDNSTDRVRALREKRNAMKRDETHGNARVEESRGEKIETAVAVSCATALPDDEKSEVSFDQTDAERRCVEATGWINTGGFSAIADLVLSGEDFEGRVLPLLRTIAGEFKDSGRDPPKVWAYAVKAIRDPSRRANVPKALVETTWVRPGTDEWQCLLSVKKESFLRGLLKPGPGGEGIAWRASEIDQLMRIAA